MEPLILSVPALILSFLLFNANRKGFIGNVENDTLEYPGGCIAPDSFLSYFSPIYLLQYIRRFTLNIFDIRQLDKYNKTNTSTNSQGKTKTFKQYLIDIDGEFGEISFAFMSNGKRDELYSLLIQTLQQQKNTLDNDMPVMEYEE